MLDNKNCKKNIYINKANNEGITPFVSAAWHNFVNVRVFVYQEVQKALDNTNNVIVVLAQ